MKIGILGSASSFHQAPFLDPSWELWACNVGPLPDGARWDRWFDLHDDASIDTYPGHREFLTSQTKPVYRRQNYPIAAMTAKYGTWFFTSSIAYMLAMALEEGPEEIGLWGVDMADATEYSSQKNGCRFFLQLALMRGIKVTTPSGCELMVPGRLYSLEEAPWFETRSVARRQELAGLVEQNQAQRTSLVLEKTALEGRRKITLTDDQIKERLGKIDAEMAAAERQGLVLDGALQQIDHQLANWTGAPK